jgi:HlyD family secretion protein
MGVAAWRGALTLNQLSAVRTRQRGMTGRIPRIGLLFVAICVIGVSLLVVWKSQAQNESKSDPTPKAVAVEVVLPRPGGIERTLTRPASIHAFQRADLFAKVSGFLQNQVVDIGSGTKAGQVLAEIFAPEVKAGVEKAQADQRKSKALVGVAKAGLATSQANLKEARAKLEQTQADLESAKATLKLREEQYNRIAALAKLKAIEEELVDEKFQARAAAQAAERSSVKAISTAQAAVVAAQAQVDRAQADLADAQAQVEVRGAELEQAQALDEYTRIRSPFDGVITRRTFQNGDFIRDAASGATEPILSLVDTHLMRVVVWVPDQDVPRMHVGNKASLSAFALPSRTFQGQLARTAMSEDYASRTMRVEIDVPNREQLLTDGMYGSASIDMGRDMNAMTIPSICLSGDEGKNGERTVYVVRKGKAHGLTVKIGANDGSQAEVLNGLTADDKVVTQHGPGFAEGVPVQIASPQKP